jgi:phosphatidylglycerol lysyltransferase
MAPAEIRIGSRPTLLVVGIAQGLGVTAGLGLAALGARLGDPWFARMIGTVAAGPSPVVFATALAASARFGVLVRRRVRLLLVVALVMLALYSGALQDLLRLTVGLSGLAVAALIRRPARTATVLRASMPERFLLTSPAPDVTTFTRRAPRRAWSTTASDCRPDYGSAARGRPSCR